MAMTIQNTRQVGEIRKKTGIDKDKRQKATTKTKTGQGYHKTITRQDKIKTKAKTGQGNHKTITGQDKDKGKTRQARDGIITR